MSSDDIVEAVRNTIHHEIEGNIHTSIPAVVESYDKSGPSVTAKPIIQKVYEDGQVFPFQPIASIPVIFPRSSRFHCSFPLKRGDGVLLIFSERSLEAWLNSGKELPPTSTAKYSLTDAMAIPGLFSLGQGSQISSADEFELVFDDVKFTSNGQDFTLTNGEAILESKGDNITLNGDDFNIAREAPLTDLWSDLFEALSTWIPVTGDGGAALKIKLLEFLTNASDNIAQIPSNKNKVS